MAKPTENRNRIKLLSFRFEKHDDIRYYNEFIAACRKQESGAKESYFFQENQINTETFIILN